MLFLRLQEEKKLLVNKREKRQMSSTNRFWLRIKKSLSLCLNKRYRPVCLAVILQKEYRIRSKLPLEGLCYILASTWHNLSLFFRSWSNSRDKRSPLGGNVWSLAIQPASFFSVAAFSGLLVNFCTAQKINSEGLWLFWGNWLFNGALVLFNLTLRLCSAMCALN